MNHLPLLMALAMSPSAPVATSTTAPRASAPASGERQIALRIEGDALLVEQAADVAEDTAYFIRTDGTKALTEAHRVRVVDDASAPAIVVSLRWINYAESIYGVKVEIADDGESELVERFECTCGDSDLTAAILERFPAALDRLEARHTAPTEPVVEHGSEPGESAVAGPSTGPSDRPPREPLGRLGKAGIGVAVIGAAALVSGGIVYAQGRRPEQREGQLEQRDGKNFRPPGIALMVAGGTALAAGAVLLIVDRSRSHRRASALVLPSAGGLVLTGRF